MGSSARNNYSDTVSDPEVVPIHPPEAHPPEASAIPAVPLLPEAEISDLEDYGARAGEILGAAVEAVSEVYGRAWIYLSDRYAQLSFGARESMSRTRDRSLQLIDERPLQVLGIIAGASFAAGVALRIWRSRKS